MKRRSHFQVMRQLIGLIRPLLLVMLVAIVLGVLGHLSASLITIMGAMLLMNVIGYTQILPFSTLVTLLLICSVSRGIFRYIEQACNHFIAFKILALIRDKVFKQLRRLSPAKLEGQQKGNLISIITTDIELLEVFYAHTISPIMIALIFSVVMVSFIGSMSWLMAIVALVAFVWVGVLMPIYMSKLNLQNGQHHRDQSGKLSSLVLDSLKGLGEIIQYGYASDQLDKIKDQTLACTDVELRLKTNLGLNQALTNLSIYFFEICMLLVGLWQFQSRALAFDHFILSIITLFASFGPLIALATLGTTLQTTLAAGNRVLDLLEENPVVEEVTGFDPVNYGETLVDQVTFSYGQEPILEAVSYTFEPGQIVGIVGKSGSGKSTLLKLLMRFWEVEKGMITVNQQNINSINTTNLRLMQSYVTQETVLFQGTIKDNLRVAKVDASDEEIVIACQKASIHDFIMTLPAQYETQLSELGDSLSGGERQRIGLARAFLYDADCMILDEPTSNLDSLNEATILKSLAMRDAGKSVILVSHRQSTMGIADKVYQVSSERVS